MRARYRSPSYSPKIPRRAGLGAILHERRDRSIASSDDVTAAGVFVFWAGCFNEGFDAAPGPQRLWPCGAEPSGERTEDIAIGTGRRQEDTDAGRTLHHARGDLDQTKAQRVELCIR
jgi:hypothetical protein